MKCINDSVDKKCEICSTQAKKSDLNDRPEVRMTSRRELIHRFPIESVDSWRYDRSKVNGIFGIDRQIGSPVVNHVCSPLIGTEKKKM